MEEKTEELYEALEKKTEELNSKNDLLEVNIAVMRNMTNTHQSKLKEMSEKVEEAEIKVEKMATFEKCLISTMLNPDLEEVVKVVKLQQEKILELERKLEEKRQVAEENGKQSNPGENLLKLRGINISLVKETQKVQERVSEGQGSPRSNRVSGEEELSDDSENSAEGKEEDERTPDELVKITFGQAGLIKPTLTNVGKSDEDGEAGEEGAMAEPGQGHHGKSGHPTVEGGTFFSSNVWAAVRRKGHKGRSHKLKTDGMWKNSTFFLDFP